jgi:hypothetical protein
MEEVGIGKNVRRFLSETAQYPTVIDDWRQTLTNCLFLGDILITFRSISIDFRGDCERHQRFAICRPFMQNTG